MSDDSTTEQGDERADEEPSFIDDATSIAESAAELGLGAVIAPFTGGETVPIVASVASMLEAGVDRLTHLGQHESPPDESADADGDEDGAPVDPGPDASIPDPDPGARADGRE